MAAKNANRLQQLGQRDGFLYALAMAATAAGAFYFLHLTLDIDLRPIHVWPVVFGFLIGAPFLMGYSNRGFLKSTVVGILPFLGLWIGSWTWEPFTENLDMAAVALIHGTALTLPVATVLFLVGVALRNDGSVHDRQQELLGRILIVGFLWLALQIIYSNFLQLGGDQVLVTQ